jgi:hypothetical protein
LVANKSERQLADVVGLPQDMLDEACAEYLEKKAKEDAANAATEDVTK